jgi:hypothetical protein
MKMAKPVRMRKAVVGLALASALLVFGETAAVSAKMDEPTPSEQEALIAEALAQGVITRADLDAPSSGSVVAAVPAVTTVAPAGGPLEGGQIVAITGTGFSGVTAVEFNDVDATSFAVVSVTRIVAKVPDASAAGAKVIKVTNGDGTNSTGASYTYGAPTVTSVVPAFADPADSKVVTITGTGFLGSGVTDVTFGDDDATEVWVVSDTQIVATTPEDDLTPDPDVLLDRGTVDVRVTRNSVASATVAGSKFLFSGGVPTITHLGATGSEVTGTDGAAVASLMTITGTRLWGVTKVNFGATAVTTPADIVVASDGNTMTVKVPTRTPGPVDVTVETVIGVSVTNLKTRFNYIATLAPTITAVTPNVLKKESSGGGGTFLVAGTGFTGMLAAKVTLKCTADVAVSSVVAVSDTSLIVTAPGNGGTAESCGLEIVNPADNTKRVTLANAVRYV